MNNVFLHGCLVGIGKKNAKSNTFKWLEKPIHNKIVSQGLAYLCTYNGTNDFYYAQMSSSNMWRRGYASENNNYAANGALQYLAIGRDGRSTDFRDTTDLYDRIGDFADIRPYTEAPFNGTHLERNTYNYKLRITLQSITVDGSETVRELGWYGKYYNQEVYKLFTRVVLDQPIELEAGDSIVATYELRLSIGNINETIIDNFFGLIDSEGNPLKAAHKTCLSSWVGYKDDWTSGSYSGVPCIQQNGLGDVNLTGIRGRAYGPIGTPYATYSTYDDSLYKPNLFFSTNPSFNFPAYLGTSMPFSWVDSGDRAVMTLKDYVPGTNYRDLVVSVPGIWPSITEGYKDIYAICHRGQVYRFGYYTEDSDPDTGEIVKTWHPQAWRKYSDKSYKFTFRYQFDTEDTV